MTSWLRFGVLTVLALINFWGYAASAEDRLPDTLTLYVPMPKGTGAPGNLLTVKAKQYSIRDPQFFKLYHDHQFYDHAAEVKGADPQNFEDVKITTDRFPIRTYRGHIVEQPNSVAMVTIWPGEKQASVYVSAGKRILWNVDHLPVHLEDNVARPAISGRKAQRYARVNRKSKDWQPTFGSEGETQEGFSPAKVDRSLSHGWKMVPGIEGGLKQVQLAVDAEPEWFQHKKHGRGSLEWALANIEHNMNLLDLAYVRDLGMSHRLTALVIRDDTNLHKTATDTIKTWKENGLGDNPGSSNVRPGISIPFQQMIMAYVNEGNPFAFRSKAPLNGGNYSRVPMKLTNPNGLSHEIAHNWGGAHFIYPRDSMSGGGPWFGATTVQRMIFLRDHADTGGRLKNISTVEYNWNVHPYVMPDLVRIKKNQSVIINVLGNDYDSNNDKLGIIRVGNSRAGAKVSITEDFKLRYQPREGFQGRDRFEYVISDGRLYNESWVQVDVGDDGLVLHYDFEDDGNLVVDKSGSGFDARPVHFPGDLTYVDGRQGRGLFFPMMLKETDADRPDAKSDDKVRPFLDFGDVTDPFDGDHSVSMWVKLQHGALEKQLPIYLIANSSSAIHKLVSGYTIHTDFKGKALEFELREQLTRDHEKELPPLRKISWQPPNGLKKDTWYHVALVIDRTTNSMQGWVDGKLIGERPLTPGSFIKGKPAGGRYTSGALGINTYKPKKYAPFAGIMDEVRIYNKALTPAEIKALSSAQ